MSKDYITTREYADMHGLPLETVRTWTKQKKIPFIKVGDSIMIERSAPIPAKRKAGRKSKAELAALAGKSKVDSPEQSKVDIENLLNDTTKKTKQYNQGYKDGFKDGYAKAKADILAKLK